MSEHRKYSDEEVRKILDRALGSEPDRGLSHDELVAIASEVGVSRESIDSAALQLHREKVTEQGRGQVLRRRRRYLASHAFVFALVNVFLFVINYLTTPGQWWVLFSVFSWAFALIIHARFALSGEVSARALLKEQRRAAHEQTYDDLAERMELAALAKLAPHSPRADIAPPRARIDAIPAAPTAEAEPLPEAPADRTPAVNRRRG